MSNLKLITQINIIFSFVTVLGCVVFLFVLNLSYNNGFENQNKIYLTDYLEEVSSGYENSQQSFVFTRNNAYNDYLIIEDGVLVNYSTDNVSLQYRSAVVRQILNLYFKEGQSFTNKTVDYQRYGDVAYMGVVVNDFTRPKYAVVVISNTSEYIKDMTGDVPFYTTLAFLNVLALGMIIIWIWSSNTVKKLKDLQLVVNDLVKNDYQKEIKIEGAEEITSLARSIDNMRQEIKNNEDTKKEMIQNLGHDLKTPIAVIKSYAEAISDGIEDIESANIIVKQADVLNKKVKQIIQYSKIGVMSGEDQFEDVSFKEVISQVVNHYKYLTQATFIVDIKEDWVHKMIKENFYVAISNIIDNAVRYVKTKIVIQLKNKKLTIFNDGERIEESLLPKIFKAYEKGSKGQFGLGLAIAKETLDRFGLKCSVSNHENGVLFTIELQ